jgi:hypothetical protein
MQAWPSNRRVMALSDFTDEDIAAIKRAEPPPEAAQFDHEYGNDATWRHSSRSARRLLPK